MLDPSGKSIEGAQITVAETQTGLVRKAVSGAQREFRVAALPVGLYTIEATATGFGTSRVVDVTATVGEPKAVNITPSGS